GALRHRTAGRVAVPAIVLEHRHPQARCRGSHGGCGQHMTVSDSLDSATLTVSRTAAEYADAVDRANCIPEQALGALRSEGLLSLLIPPALGGQGRSLSQVAAVCHALARSCGSSAMIFAMHQIQVACIVAHGQRSEWHRALLQRL